MSGSARAPRVLLLDADGNLFPSEEPAFEASVRVVNRLLERTGSTRRFTAQELRLAATGRNFRSVAVELAAGQGVRLEPAELERWVAEEREAVIAHLRAELRADPAVREPVERLSTRFGLAVVSSSALRRLEACLEVTGLAPMLPLEACFSAEDSLPVPVSKPDPAIYRHALETLGVRADEALAVEDSATGAASAIAAGIPAVGNLVFTAPEERDARTAALRSAGVATIVASWRELESFLAAC